MVASILTFAAWFLISLASISTIPNDAVDSLRNVCGLILYIIGAWFYLKRTLVELGRCQLVVLSFLIVAISFGIAFVVGYASFMWLGRTDGIGAGLLYGMYMELLLPYAIWPMVCTFLLLIVTMMLKKVAV